MKTAGIFIILSLFLAACQPRQERPPNIVFIFSDDHALRAISAYDSSLILTPAIDRLAREGMLFSNCFCVNSICAPSRAAVLTGMYSHRNGVKDNGDRFDSSLVTFPRLLQQQGYQTALIGKWHLKSIPDGFDHWEVLPDQGDYYNPGFIRKNDTVRHEGYATGIITDKSLEWLSTRDMDKPFLLMVQHKAPHRNWMPEPEKIEKYAELVFPEPQTLYEDYDNSLPRVGQEMTIAQHMFMDYDLKVASDSLLFLDPEREPIRPDWWAWEMQKMTPEQRQSWEAAMQYRTEDYRKGRYTGRELEAWKYQQYLRDYLACIESVDENIGRLLDYLDETGLAESTVVVYSSDQGFYLGEHGWYDKRWMYEESLHMPLLIRYPAEIAPGKVTGQMVQNIDFAPTFLDIAGVEAPAEMQGRSFRKVLTEEQDGAFRDAIYYHYYEYPDVHMVMKHNGIRTDRYKLIHFYEQDIWELYDLKKDPMEMHNLAMDEGRKPLLDSLKLRFDMMKAEVGE